MDERTAKAMQAQAARDTAAAVKALAEQTARVEASLARVEAMIADALAPKPNRTKPDGK